MTNIESVDVASSVVDKFAVLISLWVITELDAGDVTVWETSGSTQNFITFDADSCMFAVRGTGSGLSKYEQVFGVQCVDLHALREIAVENVGYATSDSEMDIEKEFHCLYMGQVLRYWMFICDITILLNSALSKVTVEQSRKCIRTIERTYRSLSENAERGGLAEQLLSMRRNVISDEYHDMGADFLQ